MRRAISGPQTEINMSASGNVFLVAPKYSPVNHNYDSDVAARSLFPVDFHGTAGTPGLAYLQLDGREARRILV